MPSSTERRKRSEPAAARREPLSSVVIAAYNCAATIGEALDSVLVQTFQDFEVIVVDDGSTDETSAEVKRYLGDPRVCLVRQHNQGPAAARNTGIRRSRGAYVSLLDSDDMWLSHYLEAMIDALDKHPAAGFAFTRAWVLERAANRIKRRPWPWSVPVVDRAEQLLRGLIEHNFIWNSVTVRREVLADVGAYDPALPGCEDYELWLRLAAEGYDAAYVPGPLCVGSDRPGARHFEHRRVLAGYEAVFRKLLSRRDLPDAAAVDVRGRLKAVERRIEMLDGRRGAPLPAHVRRALADATRPWRARRTRLKRPPAELASAFPLLGIGVATVDGYLESSAPITGLHEAPPPQSDAPGGLTRLVVRGAGIATTGYGITQIVSLATYLVLARLLSPADFGIFAAGSVLLGIGLVIGESGMVAALIRRRDRLEEAFNTAFVATVGGGLALTLGAIAAAPVIGLIFGSFTAGLVSAAVAGALWLRLAAIVPNARLQRNFSFMRRAVLDPLGALLFAGAAVAGALAGLGPWALVIGIYAQFTVDLVVSWAMVPWRPRPRLATMSMWRELARFGRPIFSSHIIMRITQQIPVFAVGRAFGAAVLGQLSYAINVGMQPNAAIVDIGAYSLLPAFSRISHDPRRFREALLRTVRWICAVAFPLGLLLVPLGTPAVVLIFGAKWRPAGHAVMALGVYCAARCFFSIASEAWKAAGTPGMLPRMHGLSLVLTAICVGAAAPFGLVPVTSAMAASTVLVAIYAVRGMDRVVGVASRAMVREIWPPALSAAVMAGSLFATEHLLLHSDHHSVPVGIALLAAQTLFGLAVYISCVCALSPRLRQELNAVLPTPPWRQHSSPSEQKRATGRNLGNAEDEPARRHIDRAAGLHVPAPQRDHMAIRSAEPGSADGDGRRRVVDNGGAAAEPDAAVVAIAELPPVDTGRGVLGARASRDAKIGVATGRAQDSRAG